MKQESSDQTEWIAVDWGTSYLRAWVIAKQGRILARLASDQGMAKLERHQFGPTLKGLVGEHLSMNRRVVVICCGMVGSRQGWIEAPYIELPCTPAGIRDAISMTASDEGLEVRILPGIKQVEPADVMRGEETQIAGFLQTHPGFDGVACLPGTHSKWVELKNGRIRGFKTFMTGELFALLKQQSVLRHCVEADSWNQAEFEQSLIEAMAQPEDITAALFSLRAQSLIAQLDPAAATSRLSGLLIGVELAAAKSYWRDTNLALIGSQKLIELYHSALSFQGVEVTGFDGDAMTLAGLVAAYRELSEGMA